MPNKPLDPAAESAQPGQQAQPHLPKADGESAAHSGEKNPFGALKGAPLAATISTKLPGLPPTTPAILPVGSSPSLGAFASITQQDKTDRINVAAVFEESASGAPHMSSEVSAKKSPSAPAIQSSYEPPVADQRTVESALEAFITRANSQTIDVPSLGLGLAEELEAPAAKPATNGAAKAKQAKAAASPNSPAAFAAAAAPVKAAAVQASVSATAPASHAQVAPSHVEAAQNAPIGEAKSKKTWLLLAGLGAVAILAVVGVKVLGGSKKSKSETPAEVSAPSATPVAVPVETTPVADPIGTAPSVPSAAPIAEPVAAPVAEPVAAPIAEPAATAPEATAIAPQAPGSAEAAPEATPAPAAEPKSVKAAAGKAERPRSKSSTPVKRPASTPKSKQKKGGIVDPFGG